MPADKKDISALKFLSDNTWPGITGISVPLPKPGSVSKKYSAFTIFAWADPLNGTNSKTISKKQKQLFKTPTSLCKNPGLFMITCFI